MTYLPSPACLRRPPVYAGSPPALSPMGPRSGGPSSPWSKLPGQTDGLPLGNRVRRLLRRGRGTEKSEQSRAITGLSPSMASYSKLLFVSSVFPPKGKLPLEKACLPSLRPRGLGPLGSQAGGWPAAAAYVCSCRSTQASF